MNVYFSKTINIDGADIDVEFEAIFSKTGFNYSYGSQEGFQKEFSLDDIIVTSNVDDEQLRYIKRLIWDGAFDMEAWEALRDSEY